jgi:hypothetical protein
MAGGLVVIRPVSFANFTTPDVTLDELAENLRRSKRARVMAKGLTSTDLFSIFFAEQAGRTGGR